MKKFLRIMLIASLPITAALQAQVTEVGSGPIYYTPSNVGINSSNPQVRLLVQGSNGSEGITFVNLNPLGVSLMAFSEVAGGLNTPFWIARQGSSSSTFPGSAEIWMGDNNAIRIGTNNIQRMRITAAGNIGIGTQTPAATLDVNGNVNVSGNIAAKYQDIAEWVPSGHQLSGGTVVVLNSAQSDNVVESRTAYDTKVAGVVSERPGMVLGEQSPQKSQVATTGRVKVRVDATTHPVQIGDLLVTSNTPGYAMVSEPVTIGGVTIHRPGTIIGKALEPLARGRGEILVLLTLQ